MNDLWTNYDKLYLEMNQKFIDRHWDDWNLDYLLPCLPQDKNVAILDAGCGIGALLNYFYRKGYKNLMGVDISEGQINIARQKLPDGIVLARHDLILWLKRALVSFKVILCHNVIEHLPKEKIVELIKSFADRLDNDGILIIGTSNAHNPLAASVRYNDMTHNISFTPVSLRQVAREGGFDDGVIIDSNSCDPLWQRMVFRIRDWFYYLFYRINKIPIPETYDALFLMAFRKKK